MVNQRRWLWVIFSLYFVLAVGYSLLMPLWEAPDEPAHFHLAWRIVRKGEYAPEEINYEAVQPRPYYYFASLIVRGMDQINPRFSDYYFPHEFKFNIRVPKPRFDWNHKNYRFLLGIYLLRWINILFGGLALWLNWKTFCLIAPDKVTLRLGALALAALTPQYLHIMSSVNNDVWGTVAGALLFYLGIQIISENRSDDFSLSLSRDDAAVARSVPPASSTTADRTITFWLSLLAIILALVLPLTTKLTVLPVSAALLVIIGVKWFLSLQQKRWFLLAAVMIFAGGVFLYLFFPESIQTAANEIHWRLFGLRKKGIPMEYLERISNQIIQTYWGKVGWLAVGLPNWIFNLMTALGFLGAAIYIHKLVRLKTKEPQFHLWTSTFLIALFTILAVARNGLTTGATQGRLLFPAIGAISILMVSGWHEILPERYQHRLPFFILILMFLLNIALWGFGILPVYFQPFLD
ncbi:MAG TPA: hypothetical protein VJM08_07480 [Anaerolineales bacterium]|nr:hypothetical protein [Anaerolineales bacterium]